MSRRTQEVSLLEYVIAYLQEEATRSRQFIDQEEFHSSPAQIEIWVRDAIDAYAGGAR